MPSTRPFRSARLLLALLIACAVCPPLWAAFGSPGEPVKYGVVQEVDYLHHAITVNGQTYSVAENARFSGIGGFPVLYSGMPIAYTLGPLARHGSPGAPAANGHNHAPPVITHITWRPGGT
ncbi:MAG: hypothetical protein ACRETQ_07900 [Gammaproteobacteria bacterium]